MVIDEINRLSAEYLDKDELEQNIEFCNNLQGQKKMLISEIAAFNKKLQNTQKVFVIFIWTRQRTLISESDFIDLSKDFSAEKDRLERVVVDGERQLSEPDEKIEIGDNRRELIEKYTNLEHLNREIIETLINYISVGRRIPDTRNVPIEIHWDF